MKQFESRRATLEGQKKVIEEKIRQLQSQIDGAEAQAKAYTAQIDSVKNEADSVAPLVDKMLLPKPRLLQLQRTAYGLEGQIADTQANIGKFRQAIAEQELQIAQLHHDRMDRQGLRRFRRRTRRPVIATASGTVRQVVRRGPPADAAPPRRAPHDGHPGRRSRLELLPAEGRHGRDATPVRLGRLARRGRHRGSRLHGDEQQLRFAMGVPAAPLAGGDAVQPEKALGLEIEALAELQEIDLATRIGRAGHGDPVAVGDFQGVGHAAMGVRNLRTCMYTTPLSATKPPTIW